jgi:hypothetical protein
MIPAYPTTDSGRPHALTELRSGPRTRFRLPAVRLSAGSEKLTDLGFQLVRLIADPMIGDSHDSVSRQLDACISFAV